MVSNFKTTIEFVPLFSFHSPLKPLGNHLPKWSSMTCMTWVPPGNLGNLLSISSVYQISMIYSWLRPFIMIINDLYLLVIMSTTFISRSTNSTRFEVLLAFTEAQLKRGPDLLKVGPKSRREGSKVAEPGSAGSTFFLRFHWLPEGLGIFSGAILGYFYLHTERGLLFKAFCDEDSDLRILGNGEKPYAQETVFFLPNELELKNHNVSQLAGTAPWNPGNLLLDWTPC